MTAPNFRPFEQMYENQRHLGRASFLSSEEGEEGEDEASESEDEHTETLVQPSKKRKRVANKIYIDEVMNRARRLVFHMFHHRILRIMLNFVVALAHASYLEITHLLFKRPLSNVSSRNGMRLPLSYAKQFIAPSRNMSKNSYASISMSLGKVT